ncbi:hypothetical protein [Saccharopolyspora elongata]|uniref:hypothetical protein n=1 Tax=Saccharopolyspora elongata TaxID=2530387 RepID=UPI001404820B|nr:hypothetical protein [Saccharopolyspora elongata]
MATMASPVSHRMTAVDDVDITGFGRFLVVRVMGALSARKSVATAAPETGVEEIGAAVTGEVRDVLSVGTEYVGTGPWLIVRHECLPRGSIDRTQCDLRCTQLSYERRSADLL